MRQTQNTQKNSNKKSIFIIALLLLLVAVIGFGGYTLSKYVSSKSDNGTANVAKWGFTVTANGDGLFGKEYKYDAGKDASVVNTASGATLTVSAVTPATGERSNLVAPGTTGSMTFSIGGTAEVKSKIEVSLTGNDVVLKYTTATVTNGEYAPVKWTLKKTGVTDAILSEGSFAQLTTALGNLGETVDANGTYTKAGEYTIEWAWAYESGNDALDTFLGTIANTPAATTDGTYTKATGTTTAISFNLSVSVTQLKGNE